MDSIQVRVTATPRLLADLISRAVDRAPLRRWESDRGAPLVTIADIDDTESGVDSRVLIGLARDLDEPITVTIDGHRESRQQVPPECLHQLVVELAHRCQTESDGHSAGPD